MPNFEARKTKELAEESEALRNSLHFENALATEFRQQLREEAKSVKDTGRSDLSDSQSESDLRGRLGGVRAPARAPRGRSPRLRSSFAWSGNLQLSLRPSSARALPSEESGI